MYTSKKADMLVAAGTSEVTRVTRIGSPAAACSVAGGFCYRMLLDESCIVRESQNSPAPARASDRLLSGNLHVKHGILPPRGMLHP